MRFALVLTLPLLAQAQLIPAGQAVPKTANPPVVFLDGYQSGCTDTGFTANFGGADKLLQASGLVTLYFDNCSVKAADGSSHASIEAAGAAFGQFLASLKYTDGTPVTQVDAVAHSMGGLVIRAYLSGKQETPRTFAPPATVAIRRAIFLGTPHFGSALAAALGSVGGADKQTDAMTPGSQFLFDLNSWNQGTDDLRGIQALSITGNGGTGQESGTVGLDDGVVAATSASLAFYRPGSTRLVNYCHTGNSLVTLFGYCRSSTPALNAFANDPLSPVSQAVLSFLGGTTAWQTIGQSGDTDAVLSKASGVNLQLRDKNDAPLALSGVVATSQTPAAKPALNGTNTAWSETLVAATNATLQITPVTGMVQTVTANLPAGTVAPLVVKPGPTIFPKGVIPAAGPAPFPYDLAPGAYVSIYGANLASATKLAALPYPTQIDDLQVMVNGVAAQLVYASAGLINFVLPGNLATGMAKLTVTNAGGSSSVNVRVAPAVPSIFLLDANSTAAARNALTGAVVGASAPLHAGDFLSLYLTGLGATTSNGGVDYANATVKISVGGKDLPVTYAGRTPGFAGLDQVNCQIPAGLTGSALPVVVTAAGRASNTAYLSVQ